MEHAENGRAAAKRALKLASEPTKFLSTVQAGITAIGILSGAIGAATVAVRLCAVFERVPMLAPHAEPLSVGVMVVTDQEESMPAIKPRTTQRHSFATSHTCIGRTTRGCSRMPRPPAGRRNTC